MVMDGLSGGWDGDRGVKLVHGSEVGGSDLERFVLACEVDEGTSGKGVIPDEDTQDAAGSQEGAEIGGGGREWSVSDSLDPSGIGDTTFVGANVTEDVRARYSDEGFLPAKGSSVGLNTLDDTVDSFEVLPDEAADTGVLGDGLIGPIGQLVARPGTFDMDVVGEGLRPGRNFGSEDVGNVTLQNGGGDRSGHGGDAGRGRG